MKVEKSPALPFYGKQFYDDESVWLSSLAHQGLYVALLWHQWANGSVPADVALIARLVGQREADVRRLWPDVSKHFEPSSESPDRLLNPQLEKVRDDMVRLRQNRSIAGSKGGSKAQANRQANLYLPNGDGDGVADSAFTGEEREEGFDLAWRQYPRKLGKDAARRHFDAQVKSRADLAALLGAIANYRREIAILQRDDAHVLHGSTFFNGRWRDYAPGVWVEPKPAGAPPRPPSRPIALAPEKAE
jgi:uncharacterized protein YdaU (DUF1376 family)